MGDGGQLEILGMAFVEFVIVGAAQWEHFVSLLPGGAGDSEYKQGEDGPENAGTPVHCSQGKFSLSA